MKAKVPPTWRLAEVGDAVQIENVGVMPEAGQLYRYVGLEHIEQETGIIVAAPEMDGAGIRSLKYRFDPSHILYGKLRPNLNKVALPDYEGVCSTDLLPLAVRTPALREYIAFYLRSPGFVHLATTRASGTKMPRFGPSLLLSAPLPLPPVLVQRRIVDILMKAAEIRRKRGQVLLHSNAILQAIFNEMFGHLGPTALARLGEGIALIRNGLSRRRQSSANEGTIVLRIQDVQDGSIDYQDVNRITLSPAEHDAFLLQPGDMLIVRVNGNKDLVGRSAIFCGWHEPVAHNDHLIRIRFMNDKLLPEYVSAFLRTSFGRRELAPHVATSAGNYTISQDGIAAIRLSVPALSEQRRFRTAMQKLQEAHASYVETAALASSTYDSLSSRAFSGELTAEWEDLNAGEIAAYQRIHEELPRLVLVGLLSAAEREAQRAAVMLTALMKYVFVFQMRNRARQRLYAFRPYKYGPFASEIYDHLGVLEADGLVRQRESGGSSEREWRAIELTAKGRAYAEKVLPVFDPELVSDLREVAREYGPLDHEALLDRVYAEYPEFARRSVRGLRSSAGSNRASQ